jgi:glycosyltransferase involved in cell wall biosynthesis
LKKVVHIITGLENGGAEAILYRLIINTDSIYQHEVVSLTNDGFYGVLLRDKGIKVTSLNLKSSLIIPFGIIKLIKIINFSKTNIIQTWMYHADIFGGLVAKCIGIKNIIWGIHSTYLNPNETKFTTKLIVILSKFLSYIIPSKIICCSNVALESHIEIGYCKKKMIVINNGFDTSKFISNLDLRKVVRKDLNIEDNFFVIGMIARWHPVKDHNTLLRSLNKVKIDLLNWKCILIGEGITINNQDLQTLINSYGLQENVICLGPVIDINAIINALDIHILSSSSESFGNVTAEAMSCSIPCIMTDVGEARNLLAQDCWIAEPRNDLQIAEAIKSAYFIYNNKEDWNLLKDKCRKIIIDNYSINNMISNYINVWTKDFFL